MRFYLFDRVIRFSPGVEAEGIKNVSSQEDFLIDHFERAPVMPAPLLVESLAQLGGWAVTTSSQYQYLAVMVMVKRINVLGAAGPGDQVMLKVGIESMNEYGAAISGEARVGDQIILRVGSITYVFYEVPKEKREDVKVRYLRMQNALKGESE